MDNNIHQDLVKLVEQLNNYNKKTWRLLKIIICLLIPVTIVMLTAIIIYIITMF